MGSILYSPIVELQPAIRDVVFSPLLAVPTFAALKFAPEHVHNALAVLATKLPAIAQYLPQDLTKVKTYATIWFAISVIRQVNSFLNMVACNNWRVGKAPGWNWPEEIAVVTGGSSGIGKDVVERLAKLGVRVAIFDVQPAPKELLADPKVRYYQCDVTSSESIAKAAEGVRKDFGHPTILLNNAGLTKPMPILKIPESFLRTIFGVNSMALWLTTQQFLPRMIQTKKGHIMTVASMASFVALPCGADYAATKAAALAFHESLGCELKHYYKTPTILTSVVHPNFVRTPLLKDFGHKLEDNGVRMITSEVVADAIVKRITSKRGGQIILPKASGIASGIRGWPNWLQELLRDVLGQSAARSGF